MTQTLNTRFIAYIHSLTLFFAIKVISRITILLWANFSESLMCDMIVLLTPNTRS